MTNFHCNSYDGFLVEISVCKYRQIEMWEDLGATESVIGERPNTTGKVSSQALAMS